ncbi:MAG TPA: glycosyltransferase N-terminal domain-containing protein, partial [Candidatus Binataceae bacterium]
TAKSPAISALVPWDVKPWIARALDRWRPAALFLMETELWPQLILEATRRGVPVFSVSARIYPKDFGRYQAIRRFIGPVIGRITTIFAQNEIERARFIALGMPAERCIVSGNLKYLGVKSVERRIELGIRPADWVVVFGSIHADEIEFVLRAIERFRSEGIRVVIAPRHPVSAPPIVRRCLKAGWNVALRTATHDRNEWNLLVLDTIGELAGAYAQARVAVVGGGFAKHGGHNPFEPLMAGVPVAIGTHFDHFEDEARQLGTATPPARVGDDMGELGNLLTRWMRDDAERARVLAAQSKLIPDARVIGRSYVEGLSPWLRGLST